jgi:TonB-dependent starch-binding outer membrane protein SusC
MKRSAFTSLLKAICIFLLLIPEVLIAQEFTISGKITDKNTGETLPGVNIMIKGTTTGKISDVEGNYAITLAKPSILVFSYIGYGSQELQVDHAQKLDIQMQPEVSTLDEVVIIGYGTQKKADKTGAVAYIKSDELGKGVLTDPIQGIQSKISGVLVTKKGGDPNAGFVIKIRGAAGFNSNTQPLYVIDGVPNADPTSVAPEDIENYSVLKDAASSAIYGSQGSNGVIIITTKKGSVGKGTMQFNMNFSADRVAKKLDLLTASQLRNYVTEYNSTVTDTADLIKFTDGGANTDWQDEIYRTGFTQNYNLNYSGGTERSSYYCSLTQAMWQGVMRGTEKDRTTAKINITHKALDNKLTLSGSLSGMFENNDYENYDGYDMDDIIYQALSHNPTDPVKNADGSYNKVNRSFNYENPLSVINNIENIRNAKSFFGDFKADLEILPGLTGSVNIGYTRNDNESAYFRPKGTVYASPDNGLGKKQYDNNQRKLLELTGTYIKSLGLNNLTVLGGYSWQQYNYDGFYAKAENPQSDFLKYNSLGSFIDITSASISSWAGESRLIGFFGRVQYNYDSRYYLSGSIRRDGSTKFGKNNKWGWFPTVSAGWNIDRESFMKSYTFIDQLKFRVSYGVSGNQNIGEYRSQLAFVSTGPATDPETGLQVTTFGPAWNANPDLKWERTAETNFGLDFAFFKSRLSGSLEVYTKKTSDLLGEYQVPLPPNLARTTYANSGNMKNRGIELFLQAFIIDNTKIKWKTSLNITHFKTTIGDLGKYVTGELRKDGTLTGRGLIGEEYYVTGNIEGKELGAFYLPKFLKLGSKGEFWFEAPSGGAVDELSQAKRYIAGSPAPNLEIGWSNTITFMKNFTLDFSFRSLIGNDVYNATKMFFDYPGNLPSLNAVPEALDWQKKGRTQPPCIADIYVEDGSFLRLDYVSIGYTLDMKSKYIRNILINISSNNLFTLTNYSGVDPETSIDGLSFGIDQYNVYPKTRTISLGITANF